MQSRQMQTKFILAARRKDWDILMGCFEFYRKADGLVPLTLNLLVKSRII